MEDIKTKGESVYQVVSVIDILRQQDLSGEGNAGLWLGRKHKPESIDKMRQRKTGIKASEETKKKMSLARIGNQYGKCLIGFKHSEETKKRMGASKLGNNYGSAKRGKTYKPLSEEAKAKISASLIGNIRNLGKKDSLETRELKSKRSKEVWDRRKAGI